ncbi:YraN family protein [Eubacteriales bacterium OttesenSCG-928-K08]|nr:YraN family protein [Eubacteriales bacterium OttesenSCG-928-K08]
MENQKSGAHGERLARAYLEAQGFICIGQNIRVGRNELDLVMRDGDYIVFVEVKARSSKAFGLPREAVDAKKQASLIRAAGGYLAKHAPDANARFDVVEVDILSENVTYIKNAFDAGSR